MKLTCRELIYPSARAAVSVAVLAGCSAVSAQRDVAATTTTTAVSNAATPAFVPRLLRRFPFPANYPGAGTQIAGRARHVHSTAWDLRVVDPATGDVFAEEPIRNAYGNSISIDPTFRFLCVSQRTPGALSASSGGAYDLAQRRWLWQQTLVAEGTRGDVAKVLATPTTCVFQVQQDDARLELRAAADGARVDPGSIATFNWQYDPIARWTDDRETVVVTSHTTHGNDQVTSVDVRNGRTLGQRISLWARCVEVGARVRIAIDETMEDEARRAFIARTIPDLLGECETPPRPARPPVEGMISAPWALLSASVVAFHDESGLYLWNHAGYDAPVRVEGAPPLVRYIDINVRSHPHELVVAPDASWVGVIRADGKLSRFPADPVAARPTTSARSPLPEVALPGPSPASPASTQWQVFAGPRDRLLAIRLVSSPRAHSPPPRETFVGGVDGNWKRSPARAMTYLFQSVEHRDGAGWYLFDAYHGVQRIDDASGKVVASFAANEPGGRGNTALPSSDGKWIFIDVNPSRPPDDLSGLHILDALTLRPVRSVPPLPSGVGVVEEWTSAGLVTRRDFDYPVWSLFDLATGTVRDLGAGARRAPGDSVRRGDLRIDRAFGGGAYLGGPRGTPERWLSIVPGGGAAIEPGDGRIFCVGTGCDMYRCVVSPRDARAFDDPACAALRIGGSASAAEGRH